MKEEEKRTDRKEETKIRPGRENERRTEKREKTVKGTDRETKGKVGSMYKNTERIKQRKR